MVFLPAAAESIMTGVKKKIEPFDICIIVLMIGIAVITLYPFLNVLALSFNDSIDSVKGGIYILPRKFTLSNYANVFSDPNLVHSAIVSVERTVLGTVASVLCCSMLAYTLSRQDYVLRKPISNLFVITMYVSGGLIPTYLLTRNLHLIGSFWVYIIPWLLNFYYVMIIRSFMDGLPISIQEAARIDGANDFQIFLNVIMPLCVPVIATVALWIAVSQWSSWLDTFLYSAGKESLSTLQYQLMTIMDNATVTGSSVAAKSVLGKTAVNTVSPESVQMAETIIATVPILCVYPFIQRYFVKGVTLGAVKG